jgi:KDO2-lipid IV(A) lauroyltransferase
MPFELDTPPRLSIRAENLPRFNDAGVSPPAPKSVIAVLLFWLAARATGIARAIRPLTVRLVPVLSKAVRSGTRHNATRIFGRPLSSSEQRVFTRDVVSHLYEFVTDIGRSSREPGDRILARVGSVEGEAAYRSLRARGRGVVLVTAHMGSFEVGLAALKRVERRVHVVYKRDASATFERMRTQMRRRIGVIETAIDDGLSAWLHLRDALRNGDAVVMQADRSVPGQRSTVVPFLHGHLRMPTGAVQLARLAACPIVPVFTVRLASGRFAVLLHPAIEPGGCADIPDSNDPGVIAVARAIESMVAKFPTQWLILAPAFEEDVADA